MRRQLAIDQGFVVPPIHIKDNLQLRPHEYFFLIKGIELARGEIMSDHWLAVGTGECRKDKRSTDQRAGLWITGFMDRGQRNGKGPDGRLYGG